VTCFIPNAENAAIADWIERHLADALASGDGPVAITVPGGSTPFPIFEALAARDLEWSRIAIWPGDDRVVPEEHEASNTGRIRAIFEPVGAHVATLAEEASPPPFALTWLGMGADGHIASLFPNTDPDPHDPLPVRRLTPEPLPPEAPFDRVTLTMPALLDTGALMFVIRGDEKQVVFERAARGEGELPIARLLARARGENTPVTCFT